MTRYHDVEEERRGGASVCMGQEYSRVGVTAGEVSRTDARVSSALGGRQWLRPSVRADASHW